MSYEKMNDHVLTQECDELAKDIFEEMLDDMADDETPEYHEDDMRDKAHEMADSHQWVIYTHHALQICANCNTEIGEAFLEDTGMPDEPTFHGLATIIAYGEVRGRIDEELSRLIEKWGPTQ